MSQLVLSSPAFLPGDFIPPKYTCDGENISPPLRWSGGVPDGTKTFVLLMTDPDVPRNIRPDGIFDHWVIWNIPAGVREIPEGGPVPGRQGANTRGHPQYTGPCPPDREHRYFFVLYALDAELNLPEGSTKAEVLAALEGTALASSTLIGRYDRTSELR